MSNGCEMGGGCNGDGAIALSPDCCDVSVDSLTGVSMGSPMSMASQVVLQNAPQPPPLALFTAASNLQSNFGSVSLPFYYPPNRHFVRTEIYLDTQRLRI